MRACSLSLRVEIPSEGGMGTKVSASIVSSSSKARSASRSTSMAASECSSLPSDADSSSSEAVAGVFRFPFCSFFAEAASFWMSTMDLWFAGSSFASVRFFAIQIISRQTLFLFASFVASLIAYLGAFSFLLCFWYFDAACSSVSSFAM